MSQRTKLQIKRFYYTLFYMAAVRLCPVMKKKKAQSDAYDMSLNGHTRLVAKADMESERAIICSLLGRVLGFFPGQRFSSTYGMTLVSKFQDRVVTDFEIKPRNDMQKSSLSRHDRRVGDSLKTGFYLLRVTLNLARGDLERHALHACP